MSVDPNLQSKAAGRQAHRKPLTYFGGVTLVVLAGTFWSTMGIGIRLIENANVWQILFYRSLALAVLLFTLISFRSGHQPLRCIKASGIAGVIGGLGLVIAFSGGVYAIQTTTVANAMFLFASTPFFAALLGLVLLKEQVRTGTWIAIALAMVGIVLMVRQGISMGHMIGNMTALLSALGFAIFTIALRWKRLQDMFPAVFLAGIFSTALCFFMILFNQQELILTPRDTLIAIFLGFFLVGIGLAIYTIGSKVVPAVELALLSMTEVLLGPVWVWLFLGETANVNTLIGGAILLLAIVWNALSGMKRKPVPTL